MVDRDSKQAGREDWEYLLDVAVPSLGAKWLQERAPVPPNLSLKEPEGFGRGIWMSSGKSWALSQQAPGAAGFTLAVFP